MMQVNKEANSAFDRIDTLTHGRESPTEVKAAAVNINL